MVRIIAGVSPITPGWQDAVSRISSITVQRFFDMKTVTGKGTALCGEIDAYVTAHAGQTKKTDFCRQYRRSRFGFLFKCEND
jgi:hypothetical protein